MHDASVVIDENAAVARTGRMAIPDDFVPHDDPRWPARCGCGEPFADDDRWQVNEQDWYEGGGQRFTWGVGSWAGPPGAVMRTGYRDAEGRPPSWHICLPNGRWWNTNDRASVPGSDQIGPYWQVTGP